MSDKKKKEDHLERWQRCQNRKDIWKEGSVARKKTTGKMAVLPRKKKDLGRWQCCQYLEMKRKGKKITWQISTRQEVGKEEKIFG